MNLISVLIPALLVVVSPASAGAEWTIVTGHVREVTGARLPTAPTTHRCVALREIDLRPAATDMVVATEEAP